jgi:molybdopterin-guanine dinucleotide biosynthesis protein A
MGRDKALLPFRGASLAASVARAVELAAGSATLVGDPSRYGRLGFPCVPDAWPGEGPLGGILTAMRHSRADWSLVAACDMPGLSAGFLRRLLDAARGSEAFAVLPAGPSGRPEPLCAVYHRRALPALAAAFEGGRRGVSKALDGLPAVTLPILDVDSIANVNTPEEWGAYVS